MNRIVWVLLAIFVTGCTEHVVGPPGPPGNANVQSMLVTFSTRLADHASNFASQKYVVSAITPSVVDHGAVLAYARLEGTWTALPYTFTYESADVPLVDYAVMLGYAYDDGLLELFLDASTVDPAVWAVINEDFGEPITIKVVVIDGFPPAKQVNLRNYEDVAAYYNLTD